MQCFPPFTDNISSKSSIYYNINKGFFIAMFGRRVAHATDAAGIFACDYLLVPLHHEVGMDGRTKYVESNWSRSMFSLVHCLIHHISHDWNIHEYTRMTRSYSALYGFVR